MSYYSISGKYLGLIVLVSLLVGLYKIIQLFKLKLYKEAIVVLALYLLPPIIISQIHRLAFPLQNYFGGENISIGEFKFILVFISLPLIIFWVAWLCYGGFTIDPKFFRINKVLNSYSNSLSINHFFLSICLIFVGIAIFMLSIFIIPPSIFRIVPFVLSFMAYITGFIMLVFPEYKPKF